jgi:hypothetical protein
VSHSRAMEALQSVHEHRSVLLFEHVETNLDLEVRAHTQNAPVEGRMVEGAEREPVRHDRAPFGVAVG